MLPWLHRQDRGLVATPMGSEPAVAEAEEEPLDRQSHLGSGVLPGKTGALGPRVDVVAGDGVAVAPVAEDPLEALASVAEGVVGRAQAADWSQQAPLFLAGDRLDALAAGLESEHALDVQPCFSRAK